MINLVTIMENEGLLVQEGFKMMSDDDLVEGDKEPYSRLGISEYTRIVASSNPGYVLRRKI